MRISVEVEFPEGALGAEEIRRRLGLAGASRLVRRVLLVLQEPGAVLVHLPQPLV